MIIDVHTHIFPPRVAEERLAFVEAEPVFAELYGDPKAKLATAADLLASMDESGVDISVALGFAWMELENVRLHNDYLLEAAAVSDGRILPFCTLPLASGIEAVEAEMRRCIDAGAPGFGELRPGNLSFELDSDDGRRLGELAIELDAALLFHVSEPVGHAYSGKQGLDVGSFYAFLRDNQAVRTMGAHWGGGLPFYALMPEVKAAFGENVAVDTAASSLLYDSGIYSQVQAMIGIEHVVFGSDFPLQAQKRCRARIEEALDTKAAALVLGGNARRFLRLP